MRVPMTTRDFLDRAELVYGDRVGVVDEPDPARPLARRGDVPGRGPPRPGVPGRSRRPRRGRGRAGRDRQPQLRAAAGTAARGSVVRPGAGADQLPAVGRTRSVTSSEHSGARVLLVDPELETVAQGRPDRRAPLRHRRGVRAAAALRHRATAVGGAGRGRHRHDQLHQRHDGATQGRADDAPQHLGQRGHLRHAHAGRRPRRLPAHAADVPLQRLGDAVHDRRARRAPGGAAQGRRRGDPAPRRPARRHPHVRGTGRVERGARRSRRLGRRDSRARPRPRSSSPARRRRRGRRADRVRARLAVQPDLRAHRDRAAR